jgi:hypothetical protein
VKKMPNDTQKEKVLEKLVHGKEDKLYNAKECHFVDKTIGDKYSMCFPFNHHPIPNMIILVEIFKWFPLNIVYQPMLSIHVHEIERWITQYKKFDTKAPIFAILENPRWPYCIVPRRPLN